MNSFRVEGGGERLWFELQMTIEVDFCWLEKRVGSAVLIGGVWWRRDLATLPPPHLNYSERQHRLHPADATQIDLASSAMNNWTLAYSLLIESYDIVAVVGFLSRFSFWTYDLIVGREYWWWIVAFHAMNGGGECEGGRDLYGVTEPLTSPPLERNSCKPTSTEVLFNLNPNWSPGGRRERKNFLIFGAISSSSSFPWLRLPLISDRWISFQRFFFVVVDFRRHGTSFPSAILWMAMEVSEPHWNFHLKPSSASSFSHLHWIIIVNPDGIPAGTELEPGRNPFPFLPPFNHSPSGSVWNIPPSTFDLHHKIKSIPASAPVRMWTNLALNWINNHNHNDNYHNHEMIMKWRKKEWRNRVVHVKNIFIYKCKCVWIYDGYGVCSGVKRAIVSRFFYISQGNSNHPA